MPLPTALLRNTPVKSTNPRGVREALPILRDRGPASSVAGTGGGVGATAGGGGAISGACGAAAGGGAGGNCAGGAGAAGGGADSTGAGGGVSATARVPTSESASATMLLGTGADLIVGVSSESGFRYGGPYRETVTHAENNPVKFVCLSCDDRRFCPAAADEQARSPRGGSPSGRSGSSPLRSSRPGRLPGESPPPRSRL